MKLYAYLPNNIGPARFYVMAESLEDANKALKDYLSGLDKWDCLDTTGLWETTKSGYRYDIKVLDANQVIDDTLV